MRVVNEAEDGPVFCELGEEREASCEDEKALVPSALLETEGGSDRRGLRLRQSFHVAERGTKKLVQAGERQLRLRLDPASSEDAHVAGSLPRILEQRRLADPGLSAQNERAAPRSTRSPRAARRSERARIASI